jgi:hypothetical protein
MAGLLRTTRPCQSTKNVLVLAAPTAAGSMAQPGVVARSVVASVPTDDVAQGSPARPLSRPACTTQARACDDWGSSFPDLCRSFLIVPTRWKGCRNEEVGGTGIAGHNDT